MPSARKMALLLKGHNMSTPKLILDYVYDHEAAQPDQMYLTQPIGSGKVVDYT